MAHLKTMETKGNDSTRKRWKTELTQNLYRRGLEKQDIINLYRFIDWIMVLPAELEDTYHQEIMEFEEEEKMRYVTTAERIGMEKGIEKGRIEGKMEGRIEGGLKKATKTAKNLLSFNVLTSEQIAQATGLTPEEVRELHKSLKCGNA
jgi:predicted transposase/invertase (TIGR01784 family)